MSKVFEQWASKQADKWKAFAIGCGKVVSAWNDEDTMEFAKSVINDVDENGWDIEVHESIDIDMEGWARETYEGTEVE